MKDNSPHPVEVLLALVLAAAELVALEAAC